MEASVMTSFIAGLAAFFSPCVIPLVPMYVSFLAGELDEQGASKKRLYINSLGFFIGLMSVFILMGATASSIGLFLFDQSIIIRKVLGVIVIFLGVFQLGIIKPSFLMKERKMRVNMKKARFGSALIMGAAFSFAWTPCVGTTLALVIALASNATTMMLGTLYLFVYALGFLIPFVMSTLMMGKMLKYLDAVSKYLWIIKIITGIMLIAVGYLIYSNTLNQLKGLLG